MIISRQETRFKALVSELICNKMELSAQREKRLLNFYEQSEFYYDVFCESIYTLLTKDNIDTISLDDFGYTHFNYINTDNILGYALLSKEDVISPNDDIILYIDLALKRLEGRLHCSPAPTTLANSSKDLQKMLLS